MSPRTTSRSLAALFVAASLAAAACGGDNSPTGPTTFGSTSGDTSGGTNAPSSGGSVSGTGSLAIHITDSPYSDAKALLVTFSAVSVHRTDDSWQTVPFASGTSRTCDLKKLNGPVDVLGVGSLPVGKYTQVRLVVSDARLFFDNASSGSACAPTIAAPAGTSAAVEIPSGEVKLNREFTLTTAGSTMVLDFDGDQSVKQTGSANGGGNGNGNGNGKSGNSAATGRYMMTPVIRVVSVS